MNRFITLLLLSAFTLTVPACSEDDFGKDVSPQPSGKAEWIPLVELIDLASTERKIYLKTISRLDREWKPGYTVMLVEACRVLRDRREHLIKFLERKTGKQYGEELTDWYHFVWEQESELHPDYGEFKGFLYSLIDKRFAEYFPPGAASKIKLEEIRWGGVRRDGIPPLKNPETLTADEATFLADTDVVFGVTVNGEARAYPKRILAWHEMVKDVVGGVSINGVYCTLCGSMIVYHTNLPTELPDGNLVDKHYELGTSGFLFRSNKLMYDHKTKSLWSTIKGEPVMGELVGKGIKLKPHHVVTTTWGKWKAAHPSTRVLSLSTGHRRDYGEGVAYRDYFATDRLMFTVPKTDPRLKNKAEVFVIRTKETDTRPMAISHQFLRANPVYNGQWQDLRFVVLTDSSGANLAFEAGDHDFRSLEKKTLVDSVNGHWAVENNRLISESSGQVLKRLPAHRAFWFGWFAAHPNTHLIEK